MRISSDEYPDIDYPEDPQCEINSQECTSSVDSICHHCGKKLCEECRLGIRHQPRAPFYESLAGDTASAVQYHCPQCSGYHNTNKKTILLSGVIAAVGAAILLLLPGSNTLFMILGTIIMSTSILNIVLEYRIKRVIE